MTDQTEIFPDRSAEAKSVPLADRMRPRTLDEVVGQEHLIGSGRVLRKILESGEVPSLIFWGPPGSGKTTLARIIASSVKANFLEFSAVISGIKEIKEVIKQAEAKRSHQGQRTILFVDEIHRFNKAQQDAFLPYVERGTIVLIGATTENPSFEVISALLSRSKVLILKGLGEEDIKGILERALIEEKGLAELHPAADAKALEFIAQSSYGDARTALNALELAVSTVKPDQDGKRTVTLADAEEAMQRKSLLYDKAGEEHYNLISALHKSLRDSDPDGSLYWLARMLASGEDPLYVARRMIRFATEDIGNADPNALLIANQAKEAYHFLGTPEGELALAQAVIYLALAPKSNAVYKAYGAVMREIDRSGSLPVPLVIRNAVTKLMKEVGYGAGYRYAHDEPDAKLDQQHLPDEIKDQKFYFPTERGWEGRKKKDGGNK
ncbi:MAG: AAA family ATPase [Candidatus Edwardsbacteria bacterium RIFOXYD12_FULL_50_11]|uniref:Replication-associated recombination protein A n=1 Tax=Candidatus Edwardsbacteria bacterium GWF2_54_11 TaxID=1817851 RepID=A0A1F5R4U3_9BACT|nr:MAG: AAA family ATPase [Candidatus Edwardsbacteria bacterium RifOxyC12_full_54_24]OGF06939.1 MAG: AAA family ATPase [Candidatus Edwardsbacteria bacterium RifOxyA12_full_54_48]OGF09446.1 MAG: AAA family ATPase [Candidatus Edwardsbacteria bacterium GWF2_54_11]OGF11076.1 MAG: AAA family ATPase [Candidatus Edwardsbacteria bacterium GWE2_54_12]OGF17067.1 MAG: AAA family ATPase [Candidatus Edwardsbacteria bacterium RIFOXYD12_FULL_50_11]OGJ18863.1 MAG: AAA family ATPase [Candidatus Edwardsbacteria